jgi:antitoxin component YwqK of YwqJK toxin-antitoxin module
MRAYTAQWLNAIFFIAACAVTTPASAIIQCEFNGKPVNTANGAETAGLTGLIRCRESNTGHLQREYEIKDGRNMGLQRQFDDQGRLARERRVNERGNGQGLERTFWPSGQVKTEQTQDNGQTVGILKRYFQNGKIEDLQFYVDGREVFAMAYYPEGYLYELRCPKESVTPQDHKPCGFEGVSRVELTRQDGKRGALQTWDKGRLVSNTSYNSDGSVAQEHSLANGQRVHKSYSNEAGKHQLRDERIYEADPDAFLTAQRGRLAARKQWAANGVLVEQIAFAQGREARVERWYLNGRIKERSTLDADVPLDQALRSVEVFDDTGQLQNKARITQRGSRTGVQQSFFSNGQVGLEETYSEPDARGNTRMLRRKTWDEKGQLLSDDELLEDGSRKLSPAKQ